MNRFTETVNDARRQSTRVLVISAKGSGERELTVAYTVSAPVWKTTYRVVWDPAGTPLLQGWAVVDNPTDEQERIRDNIEAFAKKSSDANPLISRYLAKADQQEIRLEQIAAETRAIEAEKLQVTQAYLKACKDLTLKRTLIADPTVR